jgi:hypothetical protein
MQQNIAHQVVLFQFAFRQTGGEMRAVNGDVEPFQQVRQRAEMVFVTMRENDRGDLVTILVEKSEIRYRDIDAVSRLLGKTPPGV